MKNKKKPAIVDARDLEKIADLPPGEDLDLALFYAMHPEREEAPTDGAPPFSTSIKYAEALWRHLVGCFPGCAEDPKNSAGALWRWRGAITVQHTEQGFFYYIRMENSMEYAGGAWGINVLAAAATFSHAIARAALKAYHQPEIMRRTLDRLEDEAKKREVETKTQTEDEFKAPWFYVNETKRNSKPD